MNKNLSDMKTNVGKEVHDTSSEFADLITVWLNRRYRRVMNTLIQAEVWPIMREDSFSTTDGTKDYTLPFDFDEMISVRDTTNNRALSQIGEQEFAQLYGTNPSTKGQPIVYLIRGDGSVKEQPTSASTLSLVSDNNNDDSQTITIRGIASSGVEVSETVVMNGTSAATSSNSYTEYFQISKDTTSLGKITGTSNSGATTQCEIPPEALQSNYRTIRLHYVPAGTYTINRVWKRRLLPLKNSGDYPVIPEVADIIETFATADAWARKRQWGKRAALIQDGSAQLHDLIFRTVSKPDAVHQFAVLPYDREDY